MNLEKKRKNIENYDDYIELKKKLEDVLSNLEIHEQLEFIEHINNFIDAYKAGKTI